MFTSLFRWLTTPVLNESSVDRPLRVRRLSLLLLAGGWTIFLVSCLCGCVLVRYGVPIRGWGELTSGNVSHALLQWTRTITESLGGVLFIAGLVSVGLFDRRDHASPVGVRER